MKVIFGGYGMNEFNIPVVLIFFRRKDTILKILERISKIKPSKIYLISDGPRNESEKREVLECREAVEKNITWNCEVIKNYEKENKGVYDRIGLGAKWVFEREERAIFLEDDNLPELTFFHYCEELLNLYEKDTRILWICGTNYLEEYDPEDHASYMFTKNLLPCGWASWAYKFNKFYDGELELLEDGYIDTRLKNEYHNKSLYKQQKHSFLRTKHLLKTNRRSCSWDYQMAFSIRNNGLYGISPCVNQIKNIGVDEFSEHGGTSLNNIMTKRFCGMDSKTLKFPLKHPKSVLVDYRYEKKIENIILLPWYYRCGKWIIRFIKPILGLDEFDSFKEWLQRFSIRR